MRHMAGNPVAQFQHLNLLCCQSAHDKGFSQRSRNLVCSDFLLNGSRVAGTAKTCHAFYFQELVNSIFHLRDAFLSDQSPFGPLLLCYRKNIAEIPASSFFQGAEYLFVPM